MAILTILILVFNFNNVFGNLEASLVVTTWVVFTATKKQNTKLDNHLEQTHKKIDELHETVKNQNKENNGY
jgi:peptidoglycan hydrolase CwlO-like protein